MVFALAVLLVQFNPVPKVAEPLFGAIDTIVTTSGKGYIDPDKVSLSSDSTEKPAPGMTAISLTDLDTTQPLSSVRVPDPAPVKPVKVYTAEKPHTSRSWLALAMVQHGAATFDAYSTRQAIGRGAVEDDPLMRPFAHSGAIYAAIQVGPLLLDYVARRMQHSEYGMVRRVWFVPQTASTVGFVLSGAHNLNVRGHV